MFVPLFGRRESRDHRQNYLRPSWCTPKTGATPRISPSQCLGWAIQRFLTKAPWDHDAVIDRLEEYLAPWLGHPEAVWVVDGTDFPKQDGKRENRGGARPLGA